MSGKENNQPREHTVNGRHASGGQRPEQGAESLSPPLANLEAELAGLVPRAERLDRDRLMYLAGWEAAQATTRPRRPRAVQVWAGAMTAATLLLAVLLVRGELRTKRTTQRIATSGVSATSDRHSAEPASPPPATFSTSDDKVRVPRAEQEPSMTVAPPVRLEQPDNVDVLSPAAWPRFGSRAEHLVAVDRLLHAGADFDLALENISPSSPPYDEPLLTMRQWMESLLNDQPKRNQVGDGPNLPATTGGNS